MRNPTGHVSTVSDSTHRDRAYDLPLLTAAEERDLLARARGGSARGAPPGAVRALQTVVLHNLPLAVHFARRYRGQGVDQADLIQEANVGLILAVEGFDLDYPVRYAGYAGYHIRRRLNDALLAQAGPIRLPRDARAAVRDWRRAEQRIMAALGAHPSPEMVAGLLGLDRRRAAEVGRDGRAVDPDCWRRSGTGPAEDLDPLALLPAAGPGPVEEAERAEDDRRLAARLAELDRRRADVLVLRFGLYGHPRLTQRQVGSRLGVTAARVGQLQATALAALVRRPNPRPAPDRRIPWPQIA